MRRGNLIDLATQAWVRATGRRVVLTDHPWLAGPTGGTERVGEEWLEREAERTHGNVRDGGGLVPDMAELGGPGFDPHRLSPDIVEFYEQTDGWRLEVWSQWSPWAWPFGWLLSRLFARRLEQLALPLRPIDAAQGMESRVRTVVDREGGHLGSAWLRRLRSTGQIVYSGWYGTATLPGAERASIRVAFPLPNGRVTVFLRPGMTHDGSLLLNSPTGAWGDNGAYLVVEAPDGVAGWVRRVPLVEDFKVFVDDEGTLRTDHAMRLWRLPLIKLHYRLEP